MRWTYDGDLRGESDGRVYRLRYIPTVRDGEMTRWATYDVIVTEGDRTYTRETAILDGGMLGPKPLSQIQREVQEGLPILDDEFNRHGRDIRSVSQLKWLRSQDNIYCGGIADTEATYDDVLRLSVVPRDKALPGIEAVISHEQAEELIDDLQAALAASRADDPD